MDNAQLVLEDILKRGRESLDRFNENMKAELEDIHSEKKDK